MALSFSQQVAKAVAKIPMGKVATYKQIATMAGSPNASRAVGMQMSKNTDTFAVPCHRVVASTGALVGYAYGNGVSTKESILRAEGVAFIGNKVDLLSSLWRKI